MVSQDEADFFAPVSVYASSTLSHALQPPRDHAKNGVTGWVTVSVVYLLK